MRGQGRTHPFSPLRPWLDTLICLQLKFADQVFVGGRAARSVGYGGGTGGCGGHAAFPPPPPTPRPGCRGVVSLLPACLWFGSNLSVTTCFGRGERSRPPVAAGYCRRHTFALPICWLPRFLFFWSACIVSGVRRRQRQGRGCCDGMRTPLVVAHCLLLSWAHCSFPPPPLLM